MAGTIRDAKLSKILKKTGTERIKENKSFWATMWFQSAHYGGGIFFQKGSKIRKWGPNEINLPPHTYALLPTLTIAKSKGQGFDNRSFPSYKDYIFLSI